jgi:hypothetical protein
MNNDFFLSEVQLQQRKKPHKQNQNTSTENTSTVPSNFLPVVTPVQQTSDELDQVNLFFLRHFS